MTIRAADEQDLPAVTRLLAACRLVAVDDAAQFGPQYAIATSGNAIAGVAGYERYGDDILLRSLAGDETRRSEGIGARLTEDRLRHAAQHGCRAAYAHRDRPRLLGEASRIRGDPKDVRSRTDHPVPRMEPCLPRKRGRDVSVTGARVRSTISPRGSMSAVTSQVSGGVGPPPGRPKSKHPHFKT